MKAQALLAWAGLLSGAALSLSSCATSAPATQQFQHFFVPPLPQLPITVVAIDVPDIVPLTLYAGEVPKPNAAIPVHSRPSDADFVIRTSDDHVSAGKRAMQEGRTTDARQEFDKAIEGLLAAPENIADRPRLERRLDELIQLIYKYDIDELGARQQEEDVSYEKSPLDGIIDMTFPTEPSLRHRVQEQIRVTASQLPLEVPDSVVGYINFFSSVQGKKILAAGLKHAGRYKPLIERVLREEGVPQELIFLAQAESGFQPRARSNKECVGLWQFAAFRGKEYGLTQTPATDDRMDPEKATRAAARHLHDLYNHFGDWYLAMAAYNCGPGCVDQAVLRTGYTDFWTLRRMGVLPKETSNYVPIILAMTLIGKNAKDYGLDNLDVDEPIAYDTIELESAAHLALIAAAVDRPLSELREYNPSLLRLVAPAGFAIHVPKGSQSQVEAALRMVPGSKRDTWRIHRVEADDSFATLAKRYGTTAAAVSTVNNDALPESGSWAVIPVAYAGDPIPVVARAASRRVPTRSTARTTVARTPTRQATVSSKNSTSKTSSASSSAKSPSVKSPSSKGPAAKNSSGKAPVKISTSPRHHASHTS